MTWQGGSVASARRPAPPAAGDGPHDAGGAGHRNSPTPGYVRRYHAEAEQVCEGMLLARDTPHGVAQRVTAALAQYGS
jgi:hypothetical protein